MRNAPVPVSEDPDTQLEQLRSEHRDLETRLAELDAHLSLSPAEQAERADIKKTKLATKDRIRALAVKR